MSMLEENEVSSVGLSDLMKTIPEDTPSVSQNIMDTKVTSLFDIALDSGSVPKSIQKYVDTNLNFEQKMSILKDRTLQKHAKLDGYREVLLSSMPDADSGEFIDTDGTLLPFRLSSSSFNLYDATDSKHILDGNTKYSKSSAAKAAQYASIAEMSGKNVNELTDDDFNNVKKYQTHQFVSELFNPNHKFEKYDPSIIYEDTPINSDTKVLVKTLGKDSNGRLLVDAINPVTGRSLGFDASNNPYMNTRFDVFKSIDTTTNAIKLKEFEDSHDSAVDTYNKLTEVYDTDGRLSESVDIAQAAFYQMGARLLKRIPGADKEYWDKVSDSETGQVLADMWSGVKSSTREEYQKEASKVGEYIEKGEYGNAIIQTFTQLDRFLADSAPQMGLLIAGTAATGGLLGAIGAGTVLGTGAAYMGVKALIGALPAGLDKAFTDMEEFEKNNNREMSNGEFARALAITTTTLVPETLMLSLFGGAAKNIFSRAIDKTARASVVKGTGTLVADRIKATGAATLIETGQEALETATDNWLTEKQSNHANTGNALDDIVSDAVRHFNSTDVKSAGLIGGVMGFALAGTGSTISLPIEIKTNTNNKEVIEHNKSIQEDYTVSGTVADKELSKQVITKTNSTTIPTSNDTVTVINDLLNKAKDNNINNKAVEVLTKKAHDLTKEAILKDKVNSDSLLKALGKTKEEFIKEEVYFSDINTSRLYNQNKSINEEQSNEVVKQINSLAKELGVSSDFVSKSIDSVKDDVSNGWRGYNTFKNNLDSINTKLQDTSLTQEDKSTLIADRDGIVFRLVALAANQSSKLEQFVEAVDDISSGRRRNKDIQYKSGEGSFKVIGAYLASKTYESGHSAYGMVKNISNDLSNIRDILNTIPKHIVDDIASQYNNSDTTGRVFRSLDNVDDMVQSFKSHATNIRQKSKSETTEANIKSKADNTFDIKKLIAKLDRLSRDNTSDKIVAAFTNDIRNVTEDQAKILKDEIDKSSIIKQDRKDIVKSKLDEIINLDKITNKEVLETETKVSSLIERTNNLLDSNSSEVVNNTNYESIELLSSTLKDIKSIVKELSIFTNEDSINALKDLRNKFVEIRDRIKLLIAEESEKVSIDKTIIKDDNSENIPDTATDTESTDTTKKDDSTTTHSTENTSRIEKKDYASTELLNEEYNNSVTFMADGYQDHNGKGFNLNNELIVRNNPDSNIGVIKNSYSKVIDRVKVKAKSLKLNLNNVMLPNGSTISNPLSYFTKTNGIPGGMLLSSPHLRLLYNMSSYKLENSSGRVVDSVKFDWNDTTLAAVDFSVREFLSSVNLDKMVNPITDNDVASVFGENADILGMDKIQQLRDVIKTHGVPRDQLADRIGTVIVGNLGISENTKTSTRGYYRRTVSGIGAFALDYANELGYFRTSIFDPSEFNTNTDNITAGIKHVLNNRIPTIKYSERSLTNLRNNFLGVKNKDGVRVGGLKDQFKLNSSIDKEPRWHTIKKLPKTIYMRNTEDMVTVPSYVRDTMEKLSNMAYEVDTDIIDFLGTKENLEALTSRLGFKFKEERDFMSFDSSASAEGVNISVLDQINNLIEHASKQKRMDRIPGEFKGIYFDWFMSKNGRLFMDSTTLNPQANKTLQRFLCLPQSIHRDFDFNNELNRKSEYFAIAQAFDSLGTNKSINELGDRINALSLDEIKKIREDLLHKTESSFKSTYKELGLQGIENFGHALNVLQHLIRRKEANGKVFKTWLAVENDSTTSGYFIKFLQFTDPKTLDNYGEKTGIIRSGSNLTQTEIHELKKQAGFLDIYKTMAKVTTEHLPDLTSDYIDSRKGKILKQFEFIKDNKTQDITDNPNSFILTKLFEKMNDALPKADKDGNVSSTLRKLLKSPVMVYGYGAGRFSIDGKLSYEIMSDFISMYMDIDKEGGFDSYIKNNSIEINSDDYYIAKSVIDAFNEIDKLKRYKEDSLIAQLKTKSTSDIWVKFGDKTVPLNRLFNEVLSPTYGNAVWNALSEAFSAHERLNTTMNDMFVNAFYMFNEVLTSKLEALNEQHPYGIPTTKYKDTVDSLFDLWPSMKLAYGEELRTDGMMLLMNSEKQRDSSSQVQNYKIVKDGNKNKLETVSLTANIRKFINANKAGAVLPIHFVDGMGMAMILSENYHKGITPVHDAIVISALDNLDLTRQYNSDMYSLGMNYNIYDLLNSRFNEILNSYSKETGKSIEEILDAPVKDAKGRTKESIANIRELLNTTAKLNGINNLSRDVFYSETSPVYITNMDGIEGSGVVMTPSKGDISNRFKQALERSEPKYASGPRGYQTNSALNSTLQSANVSIEGRINLLDDIQNLSVATDNKVASPEHLSHLKDIISNIAPEYLMNLIVKTTSTDYNLGELRGNTVTIGFDSKVQDLDVITKLSVYSSMSQAEIYAHELVHAGIRFALANKDDLGFTKDVNQLFALQKAAMDIITWEDFMPNTYDHSLKNMYETHAKNTWDYIFNNDGKGMKGLHEFIAYGLTNEAMMNKLSNNYMPNIDKSKNTKFADKLINLVKGILDVVFSKKKFSDAFKFTHEYLKGNNSLKSHNMFKELVRLQTKISSTNDSFSKKFIAHPRKLLESIFTVIGNARVVGNKYISPILDKAFNIADISGKTRVWNSKITGSWINDTALLAESIALFAVSKSRRKVLKQWLTEIVGFSQQGTIMSMLRDITEPDLQSSRLDMVSLLTRMVDTASKGLEASSYAEMKEAFNKDLSDLEQYSLTKSLLYTDMQSIFSSIDDIDFIKSILTDDVKLDDEISKVTNEIKVSSTNSTWIINQAKGLALFMTSGRGNAALNMNATNIAEGKMLSNQSIEFDPKLVDRIDRLVTLHAIKMTGMDERNVTASLNNEGLATLLATHKQFVKESVEGVNVTNRDGSVSFVQTVNQVHAAKGYTKQLLDTSYDVLIDLTTEGRQLELKKDGYILLYELKENKITNNSNVGVYRRSYASPNRRDGASFILNGQHAMGTSLRESASMIASNTPTNIDKKDIWSVFYKNAIRESEALNNVMTKRELSTNELIKKYSNYSPIISPTSPTPVDFRITMSNDNKVKDLGMNINALTILSKMYASHNTKINAATSNKMLIEFIKDDVRNNMNPKTFRDLDGHKYVPIEKNTSNKYLKEAWNVIPNELKEEIANNTFYIREDWLQNLFGVASTSINELRVVKKLAPTGIKRVVALAEYILKNAAYMAKRQIVILLPKVLLGNIMSNFNFSIMNGADPITVLDKQIANAKAIRDYIDTKKELNRIVFKERIGTATKKEISSKNWYKSKLENNMVHPLMEKGMYQAIVEDINPDELESIGKIQKMLKNNKLTNKLPSSIKWIAKNLYMTEGTPIFDFMFQMTQYSDFIARAAEYQIQMKKAPKKYIDGKINDEYQLYEEKVSINVLNTFINYDKPQSKLEQYLNDIGLIMFSKFGKRIQPIVNGSILKNPMGVMMFLIGQYSIISSEDILEQNMFNKYWSSLVHNPIDNMIDASIPMPLQYYYGMRSMW